MMDYRKEFQRKLSSARSIAFDVMAILDRLEAEMDKGSATQEDISRMNYYCDILSECDNAISGYAAGKLG